MFELVGRQKAWPKPRVVVMSAQTVKATVNHVNGWTSKLMSRIHQEQLAEHVLDSLYSQLRVSGGSTPNIKKEISYFSLYLLSWELKKGKENIFLKYFLALYFRIRNDIYF